MASQTRADTSLLEVIYSAKEEHIFLRGLADEALQIAFDEWWSSMEVQTKHAIVWKNSRHASSWRFFRHCAIAENGCPGVICIVCHTVLTHPSENGTSTMGKHLLTKSHKAKLSELTVKEVDFLTGSAGDEQVLAALKKKGSQGVMVASHPCQKLFQW